MIFLKFYLQMKSIRSSLLLDISLLHITGNSIIISFGILESNS